MDGWPGGEGGGGQSRRVAAWWGCREFWKWLLLAQLQLQRVCVRCFLLQGGRGNVAGEMGEGGVTASALVCSAGERGNVAQGMNGRVLGCGWGVGPGKGERPGSESMGRGWGAVRVSSEGLAEP